MQLIKKNSEHGKFENKRHTLDFNGAVTYMHSLFFIKL